MSSTERLASVICASVVSGATSDTAPTSVVLPTPKPPATTILADCVGPLAADVFASESNSPKPTEHPLHEFDTGAVTNHGCRGVHQHKAQGGEVANEHSHH